MMNFEKYTNSSKKIINSAQNLALSKKHQKIAKTRRNRVKIE